MDVAVIFIGLFVGIGIGVAGTLVAVRGRLGRPSAPAEDPALAEARHREEVGAVRSEEAAAQARLREQLASTTAVVDGLREQVEQHREQYRELVERQRAEQRERTEKEQAESKVLQALAPVRDSLHDMKKKVGELEEQRTRQHGELTQRLRSASESEERLRSTAESLAAALKSNSTRGVWGETQLRSVVEAAGLLERVDFDVQSSITSDAGAGRPDMIVHLPGGKSIAVDAKAPFNAFLEASTIPATATGAEESQRAALIKQHVKAVRDHIATLGGKEYWSGLEASPEIVIAFIPSESLVSAAMEADPTIMEYAFGKRVALASPVTLWSVLKTVAFTWQQDVLTEDAKRLFDLSRELLGRLTTMAGHLDKLGRSIKAGVNDYNKFVGSLERQVLPSARRLNALDESKVIPGLAGVEETPREVTAPELVGDVEPLERHEEAAEDGSPPEG